jgi:hypothetical protein
MRDDTKQPEVETIIDRSRSIKKTITLIEDGAGGRALVTHLREPEIREVELNALFASLDLSESTPDMADLYDSKVVAIGAQRTFTDVQAAAH